MISETNKSFVFLTADKIIMVILSAVCYYINRHRKRGDIMKIKAAIELTGLSDRTIRFYLEEGLISPSFNENYLGRKSFDFSDENIIELKNVAVLRKYDFTVAEIREILRNAETSKEIIRRVKNRNKQVTAEAQARQSVLTRIDDNRVYTVSELAYELSKTPVVLSKSEEDVEQNGMGC